MWDVPPTIAIATIALVLFATIQIGVGDMIPQGQMGS